MKTINWLFSLIIKLPDLLRIRYRFVRILCPMRPPDFKSRSNELWFEEMVGLSHRGDKFGLASDGKGLWNKDDGSWYDYVDEHYRANREFIEYTNAKLHETLLK